MEVTDIADFSSVTSTFLNWCRVVRWAVETMAKASALPLSYCDPCLVSDTLFFLRGNCYLVRCHDVIGRRRSTIEP